MAKHKKVSTGDKVSWRSHGGKAVGTVKRKITRRGRAAGRTVDASPEEPRFEVKSAKSGGTAVHKARSLHKRGGG